jgi:hypothetical protein
MTGQWTDIEKESSDEVILTNEELWKQWKEEHKEELTRIDELLKEGHTRHCACRLVWGDGCCECGLDKSNAGC